VADDVVAGVLLSSHEGLDPLDAGHIALESTPDDRTVVASVFRTIHIVEARCHRSATPDGRPSRGHHGRGGAPVAPGDDPGTALRSTRTAGNSSSHDVHTVNTAG
jgi:hypothetical protein